MLQQLQRHSAHDTRQARGAEKHLHWVPPLLPALPAVWSRGVILLLLLRLLLAVCWAGGSEVRARWRRCGARSHLQSRAGLRLC